MKGFVRVFMIAAIVFLAGCFVAFEIAIGGHVPAAQKWAIGGLSMLRLVLFLAAPLLWSLSVVKGLAVSAFSIGLMIVVGIYGANLEHLDPNQRLLYQVLNVGVLLGEATLALLMSKNSKIDEALAKAREWEVAFDSLVIETDKYKEERDEMEMKVSELKDELASLSPLKNEVSDLSAFKKKYEKLAGRVKVPTQMGNRFYSFGLDGIIYRSNKDASLYNR